MPVKNTPLSSAAPFETPTIPATFVEPDTLPELKQFSMNISPAFVCTVPMSPPTLFLPVMLPMFAHSVMPESKLYPIKPPTWSDEVAFIVALVNTLLNVVPDA